MVLMLLHNTRSRGFAFSVSVGQTTEHSWPAPLHVHEPRAACAASRTCGALAMRAMREASFELQPQSSVYAEVECQEQAQPQESRQTSVQGARPVAGCRRDAPWRGALEPLRRAASARGALANAGAGE